MLSRLRYPRLLKLAPRYRGSLLDAPTSPGACLWCRCHYWPCVCRWPHVAQFPAPHAHALMRGSAVPTFTHLLETMDW